MVGEDIQATTIQSITIQATGLKILDVQASAEKVKSSAEINKKYQINYKNTSITMSVRFL